MPGVFSHFIRSLSALKSFAKTLSWPRLLFAFAVLLSSFSLFVMAPAPAAAQGWQMFADSLKKEAQEKRDREKQGLPPVSDDSNNDENGGSEASRLEPVVPPAIPTPNPAYPPQVSPQSARDADEEASPNEPLSPNAQPCLQTDSTSLSASQSADSSAGDSEPSRRGILDFSDDLGEDASAVYAVETEREENRPILREEPKLPPYRNPPRMKNDAALNHLTWTPSGQLWAVGDRGTVWTSLNGGAKWLLVNVPTDANLYAALFLDDQTGIVAGGKIVPGKSVGQGVLLRTENAGRSWEEIPLASFPILRRLILSQDNINDNIGGGQNPDASGEIRILALGDSSELYPSGLFVSEDGGANWSAKTDVNRHHGWKDALYSPALDRFIGAAPDGRYQTLAHNVCQVSPQFSENESFHALSGGGRNFWLVGSRGLVLTSQDGGLRWNRPLAPLPAQAANSFDFQAVSVRGAHIRIAGDPGTLIFASDDGGAHWRTAPTGISVPLRHLAFIDDLHGWGIGELGNIIATRDGGQTWTVQREGGRRLAYLGLFERPEAIPFALIAKLSAAEGFLGGAALLIQKERDDSSDTLSEIPASLRLSEGLLEAGGCGGLVFDRFKRSPLDLSVDKMIERFNRENDGRGLEIFRERLVRLLRTYRPSVLIFEDPTLPLAAVIPAPAPLALSPQESDLHSSLAFDLSSESEASQSTSMIRPAAYSDSSPGDTSVRPAAYVRSSRSSVRLPGQRTASGRRRLDPRKLALLTEFTRHLENAPKDPFRAWLESEIILAVKNAADPLVYPEQITESHLAPWSVSRVQMILSEGTEGNIIFSASEYAPLLGRGIDEIAERARSAAESGDSPNAVHSESASDALTAPFSPTAKISLATVYDREHPDEKFSNVFAHLNLPAGGEARRGSFDSAIDENPELTKRYQSRREALEMIRQMVKTSDEGGNEGQTDLLLTSMEATYRKLAPSAAVDYLLALGSSYAKCGKWESAETAFAAVVENYPEEPKACEAFRWLLQYYAGSEAFWQTQDKNRYREAKTDFNAENPSAQFTTRQAIETPTDRLLDPNEVGNLLRDLYPEIYMAPDVRFPMAAIQRQTGYGKSALGYYLNRSLRSSGDLTGIRAKAEWILLTPSRASLPPADQIPPLPAVHCPATPKHPYLDGVLEDEVWQYASRFSLSEKDPKLAEIQKLRQAENAARLGTSAGLSDDSSANLSRSDSFSTELGTFVSLLYDSEFLYLGIEACGADNFDYALPAPPSASAASGQETPPRRRDTDLSASDRIEISLDLDRDYASYYRFVFDWRGWVNDECWHFRGWNPRIFVANRSDGNKWTLEIAIPWEELADHVPARRETWGIALRRLVPNVGEECWNSENSRQGNDGFGWVIFGKE